MGRFTIIFMLLWISVTCKGQDQNPEKSFEKRMSSDFSSFGERIVADGAVNSIVVSKKYDGMTVGDTLPIKFKGSVVDVCQAKGCWMKVRLENDKETMVRFKDYGFFMPKDINGKEVVVNGLAYIEEINVEDQKHYAKDAGKSVEEINQIVTPKKTYGFEADGVLLKL